MLDRESADVPSFVLRIHCILLQETVALGRVDDGLLAVALQRLKTSEENTSGQHEPQVGWLASLLRLDEELNRPVALLKGEARPSIMSLTGVDDASQKLLMQSSNGGDSMFDGGLMSSRLEHHSLPKRRIEITC